MSNYLAIATVTAALSDMLQTTINADVDGATVTTLRPDGNGAMPTTGLNVFLYQVTPNAHWRNSDLPTRRDNGDPVQRPRAALDLHYLLSCYGADAQLEPQRVLGSIVRTLHAQPILTRDAIRQTIAKEAFSFLKTSNLADDIELVRFTPLALNLEELSKLWSVYFQTPYRLSVAYQATVVLIESDVSTHAALPVQRRNLYVVPFRQPVIEEITLVDGGTFIEPESTVVIRGKRLRGEITEVHAGSTVITPAPDKIRDTQITIDLPPALRAGVQALQVVQPRLMGTPPVAHAGVESNLAPFILHPLIVDDVSIDGDEITVNVKPDAGEKQRAVLLLDGRYSFDALPRTASGDTLTFAIHDVDPGTYLVRVRIDGAESPLQFSDGAPLDGPKVTIP